jgi:2-dehydropantoate 2-reductase
MAQRPVIGIVGAGAIGCALAGRLAAAGQDVLLVARGARAEALRRDGLTLIEDGKRQQVFPRIGTMDDLGACDLVVVSVKAQVLPALVDEIAPRLAAHAHLLPAVNGFPFWYFHGLAEAPVPQALTSSVGSALPAERLLGCVVYSRAMMADQQSVEVFGQHKLKIGSVATGLPEPGAITALRDAGMLVDWSHDIRQDMWRKLARNAATNLVSGLTGASLGQIHDDPGLVAISRGIVAEVNALSARLGCPAEVPESEFLAELQRAGPFVTSMLQDIRAGREPEIDAIATSVIGLAKAVDHPMPVLSDVTALLTARLRYGAQG